MDEKHLYCICSCLNQAQMSSKGRMLIESRSLEQGCCNVMVRVDNDVISGGLLEE